MKNLKFNRYLLLLPLFILILASCGSKKESKENEEVVPDDIVEMRADQVKLAGIELGQIGMQSLSGTMKVNGVVTVSPQNAGTVCAPMGGFVKATSLLPGNPVLKGQELAVIENPEFIEIQQNYLESLNKLEYAEAEYKRHTELFKEDVYSEKNLQQVTTDYKNLKVQVRALAQKLALIGINPKDLKEDNITRSVPVVAPIGGFIRTANVNIGKYVGPSDVMFEIVNEEKLLLELTLFEKDAARVTEGQKIRFFINNEEEQHDAVIYQTAKSINSDKTYKIYAAVTGNCKNVIPGMYVNALIEGTGNLSATLPAEAVVSFDDKDYIFLFSRDKTESGQAFTEYRMVEVKKGIENGGYMQVVLPDGIDLKNAKVVTKGAYNLLSAKKNAGEMAC
ncbi:MAG: efflux RND transporter periplasmic adaptor subunit [Syntrophothermus sp.]